MSGRDFPLMCHSSIIQKCGDLRDVVSVQSLLTRHLSALLNQPLASKCRHCSGNRLQSTWSMAALTWIWFEIFPSTHILPLLTLTFDQFGEPQTFKLVAIVYLGEAHFIICWCDYLGVWWKHDGRRHQGAPVVDVINNKSDLRHCEGKEMTVLVYSFQHDM